MATSRICRVRFASNNYASIHADFSLVLVLHPQAVQKVYFKIDCKCCTNLSIYLVLSWGLTVFSCLFSSCMAWSFYSGFWAQWTFQIPSHSYYVALKYCQRPWFIRSLNSIDKDIKRIWGYKFVIQRLSQLQQSICQIDLLSGASDWLVQKIWFCWKGTSQWLSFCLCKGSYW